MFKMVVDFQGSSSTSTSGSFWKKVQNDKLLMDHLFSVFTIFWGRNPTFSDSLSLEAGSWKGSAWWRYLRLLKVAPKVVEKLIQKRRLSAKR